MKLRFLVPALASVFLVIGAQAQTGLYFNPIVSIVHNSSVDTGTFAFLGSGETQQIFGGVMFGGYYNVFHSPKFDTGFDLRDEIEHGNNASLNTFLFSARFTYKPDNSSLRPYLQVGYGAGRTKAPQTSVHVTKGEFAAIVGVDRPISKHVDWRVLEVGYGSLQTISSSIFSGIPGEPLQPAATLINFSTGLVFRIP